MEMRLIQRFGFVLMTLRDGRTLVANQPVVTPTEIRFPVVGQYDNYEDALTHAQLAAHFSGNEETALAITD